MATLTIDPKEVRYVAIDEAIRPAVAGEAIEKGQNVSPNGTSGRMVKGGGAGIAFTKAVAAKYELSVMKRGIMEMGAGIQGMAFGASVYGASDGSLNDAATGNVRIGRIIVGWSDNVPRKLLRVEC